MFENSDIFSKTGRELLPPETVEYFQGFRSADYIRVLNCRLSEYTWFEWLVCLHEKVLLEQCLPFVFEKLDMNPLIPGPFYRGEILYKVTQIDKSFWDDHKDLVERFRQIMKKALKMIEESDNVEIRSDFIEAYKKF